MKKRYFSNRMIQIGLALVIFGWGPLLAIIVLAALGIWPDPNPNPIGPGLLFFFTSWPAIICLGVGAVQVMRSH
jgi:hypothetical protein